MLSPENNILVGHHYQRFPQHFQLESIDIHEFPPILAIKKQSHKNGSA